MGTLSLEKIDHLLWLGRYVERSYTTLRFITVTYDKAIDSTDGNWKGQLEELGFASETENVLEFFRDCLFNEANLCSLAHSMGAAYDNAVMLRDVLGTESLSYVQMATDAIKAAESLSRPCSTFSWCRTTSWPSKGASTTTLPTTPRATSSNAASRSSASTCMPVCPTGSTV